jgi:hypothetical protein
MDKSILHRASRAAGLFQRQALAHLDRPKPELVERDAQDLADLLGALGFQPRPINGGDE